MSPLQIIKSLILFTLLIITTNSLKLQLNTTHTFYSPYCGHCRTYLPKNIQIVKSQQDHCQYFIYNAFNHAQLLVVQDPKRGQVINLEIGFSVGSLMDPSKYYGLAHYLQHMIFRGSQHFNKQQSIISYIQLNSGQFNAYTSLQRTSYFFQINQKNFEHTASMMLDGLKYPLFSQQSAQKQISAIDQEYHLAKNNNQHKVFQLFSTNIFKQQFKRFPPGNKQILTSNGSVSYQKLSQQLRSFHNKYYTSNRIKAVLYMQKLDLNLIQDILKFIQKFQPQTNYSQTKNSQFNTSPIDLDMHNYYLVNHTAQKKHIIKGIVLPYQEINKVKVHSKDYPCLKILNYILNVYLSKKLMNIYPQINSIKFQSDYFIGQRYPLIQFTINLLKEEQYTSNQIGKKIFAIIHFYLKSDSLLKKLSLAFNSMKKQMQLQFDNQVYKGKNVIQYVNWLSVQMHNIDQDYQNLIKGNYNFKFTDQPKFELDQIHNFKIYYIQLIGNSISQKQECNRTKFFKTAFKNVNIDLQTYSNQISTIITQFQKEQFHPKQKVYKNSYLQQYLDDQQTKKQLKLKWKKENHKKQAQINLKQKNQELLVIRKTIKFFHLQNSNDLQTQQSLSQNVAIIYTISHQQYKSSLNSEDLFMHILINLIEKKIYHEKMLVNKILAEIKIIKKFKHKMTILKIVGPPKPSLNFLEVFVRALKQEAIRQNEFQIEKKNIKATCKDFKSSSKPIQIMIQEFDRLVNTQANLHSFQQMLTLIQQYSYQIFKQQRKRLSTKLKDKWVIISNKEKQDQVFQLIQNSIILNSIQRYQQNYKQNFSIQDLIKQKNQGKEVIKKVQLPDIQPNTILAYYNLGKINIQIFLITKLIAKIINQKLFKILRSQKQFAYQTFAQQYLISTGEIGILMFIASNNNQAVLIKQQMQKIVQDCYKSFDSDQQYTDQLITSLKQSILKDLIRQKQNLIQNSDDYSYYLQLCPSCLVQWKEKYQKQIEYITKQTVKQSIGKVLKKKNNKVWILSQKKNNIQKQNVKSS